MSLTGLVSLAANHAGKVSASHAEDGLGGALCAGVPSAVKIPAAAGMQRRLAPPRAGGATAGRFAASDEFSDYIGKFM